MVIEQNASAASSDTRQRSRSEPVSRQSNNGQAVTKNPDSKVKKELRSETMQTVPMQTSPTPRKRSGSGGNLLVEPTVRTKISSEVARELMKTSVAVTPKGGS